MTKNIKLSIYKFEKWVYSTLDMKKIVVFVLLLMLIGISSAFCDDGDYITIVCEVKEIKPEFSINTTFFEDGTVIRVTQDNMARYYGSYAVDVKLQTITGEYVIENLNMENTCHSIEYSSGLYFRVDYDGRTVHPHTIAQWTMKAVTPKLYGTVTLSFRAI